MYSDCRDSQFNARLERLLSLVWHPRKPELSAAPAFTYVETLEHIEPERFEDGRAGTAPPAALRGRGTRSKRSSACRRIRRRKSFTPRARRQRRREIAELEQLPIVRRARAAGLHGAALRAYVAAVERLDGPLATLE